MLLTFPAVPLIKFLSDYSREEQIGTEITVKKHIILSPCKQEQPYTNIRI